LVPDEEVWAFSSGLMSLDAFSQRHEQARRSHDKP
jgi:hypothetical protein